jgi:ABC-type phosphate transport system substrate-binding protein
MLFLSAGFFPSTLNAEEYAVILNAENLENLERDQLLQIFKKEFKYWKDGSNVIAYLPKSNEVVEAFFDALGTSREKIDEHFNRLREQGSRDLPPLKKDTQEIKRILTRNKAAIGIFEKSQAEDLRIIFTFKK